MLFLIMTVFTGVTMQNDVTEPPRVGLVLSGGGSRGFAHIGVLKVLEEAGLKFDYIAGTSMGSIVGGLYASGFTAQQIESLTTTVDWTSLFKDEVRRRDMPFDGKPYAEKYIGGLNFEGFKPVFPLGLIEGQKIEACLSSLIWRTNTTEDFSDLPIPFICVASDVEKAQAVILNRGNLAESMRASMAIPTVFTPVTIDGILLVDGGAIRNFPVEDMKDLGADFILGVDVGTPTKEKSELRSAVDIINQVIGFRNTETNPEQRSLCDFLITPDLDGFSSYDFSSPEMIIEAGESTAREALDSLIILAEGLNKSRTEEERNPVFTPDSVFVVDIYVMGLNEVTRSFVVSTFEHQTPGWLDSEKIEKGIERIYNTMFFKKVNYRLKKTDEAYVLVIVVEENKNDRLNLGLRYDSYENAQMLLNLTMRNLAVHSSKLICDLKLGENYSFGADYYVFTALGYPRNKVGIVLSAGLLQKYYYLYHEGVRYAKLDGKSLYSSFSLGWTFSGKYQISTGVKFDFSSIKPSVAPIDFKNTVYSGLVFTGRIDIDNLDRICFPKSGVKTVLEASVSDRGFGSNENFVKLEADMAFFVPAAERVVLFWGVWGGVSQADSLSLQNMFYTGGHKSTACLNTFLGYENMELTGMQMAALRAGLRIEPLDNRFFEFQINAAKTAEDPEDLFEKEKILYGAGMTFGLNTPIGPVYVSLAGKNIENINFFLNIGYDF